MFIKPYSLGKLGRFSERRTQDRCRTKRLKYLALNQNVFEDLNSDYTPQILLSEREKSQRKSKEQKELNDKYGSMKFLLNKTHYCPGDTVMGLIMLDLIKPISGNKICLKIKGSQLYQQTREEVTSKITAAMKTARVAAGEIDDIDLVEEFVFYHHEYIVHEETNGIIP